MHPALNESYLTEGIIKLLVRSGNPWRDELTGRFASPGLWHGTFRSGPGLPGGGDFGGIHVGTRQAAKQRLEDTRGSQRQGRPGGERLIPVRVKPDARIYGDPDPIDETELFQLLNLPGRLDRLRAEGYQGIAYRNSVEDPGSISYLVFEPESLQVRGRPSAATYAFSEKEVKDGVIEAKAQGEPLTLWRKGVWGKGFIGPDGQLVTWPTSAPGQGMGPHHQEIAPIITHGSNGDISHEIVIAPNGEYTGPMSFVLRQEQIRAERAARAEGLSKEGQEAAMRLAEKAVHARYREFEKDNSDLKFVPDQADWARNNNPPIRARVRQPARIRAQVDPAAQARRKLALQAKQRARHRVLRAQRRTRLRARGRPAAMLPPAADPEAISLQRDEIVADMRDAAETGDSLERYEEGNWGKGMLAKSDYDAGFGEPVTWNTTAPAEGMGPHHMEITEALYGNAWDVDTSINFAVIIAPNGEATPEARGYDEELMVDDWQAVQWEIEHEHRPFLSQVAQRLDPQTGQPLDADEVTSRLQQQFNERWGFDEFPTSKEEISQRAGELYKEYYWGLKIIDENTWMERHNPPQGSNAAAAQIGVMGGNLARIAALKAQARLREWNLDHLHEPFRSIKQREYLRRNHPELYERWRAEHGDKIVPSKKKRKQIIEGVLKSPVLGGHGHHGGNPWHDTETGRFAGSPGGVVSKAKAVAHAVVKAARAATPSAPAPARRAVPAKPRPKPRPAPKKVVKSPKPAPSKPDKARGRPSAITAKTVRAGTKRDRELWDEELFDEDAPIRAMRKAGAKGNHNQWKPGHYGKGMILVHPRNGEVTTWDTSGPGTSMGPIHDDMLDQGLSSKKPIPEELQHDEFVGDGRVGWQSFGQGVYTIVIAPNGDFTPDLRNQRTKVIDEPGEIDGAYRMWDWAKGDAEDESSWAEDEGRWRKRFEWAYGFSMPPLDMKDKDAEAYIRDQVWKRYKDFEKSNPRLKLITDDEWVRKHNPAKSRKRSSEQKYASVRQQLAARAKVRQRPAALTGKKQQLSRLNPSQRNAVDKIEGEAKRISKRKNGTALVQTRDGRQYEVGRRGGVKELGRKEVEAPRQARERPSLPTETRRFADALTNHMTGRRPRNISSEKLRIVNAMPAEERAAMHKVASIFGDQLIFDEFPASGPVRPTDREAGLIHALADVPEADLMRVAAQGTQVVISRRTDFGELFVHAVIEIAGDKRWDDEEGRQRLYEMVNPDTAGLYDPYANQLLLGGAFGVGTGFSPDHIVTHEVGHALTNHLFQAEKISDEPPVWSYGNDVWERFKQFIPEMPIPILRILDNDWYWDADAGEHQAISEMLAEVYSSMTTHRRDSTQIPAKLKNWLNYSIGHTDDAAALREAEQGRRARQSAPFHCEHKTITHKGMRYGPVIFLVLNRSKLTDAAVKRAQSTS